MADPVRRKPLLQIIREGNPSKNKLPEAIMLPPGELEEPDWLETFPSSRDELQAPLNKRCREVARREWRRVVPVLRRAVGLAEVDAQLLHDYCVCVARIDQAERDLSRHGLTMLGERGWQKNGSATIVSQYRAQLKVYIRELGLSPSARTGMSPPRSDDDDSDPFGA